MPYSGTTSPVIAHKSLAQTPEAGGRSIYNESLDVKQFRIPSLSASEHEDGPIHGSLQTHSHDDCPEYECMSYTWGGEKGDATLSIPIYIGGFWDVLLQT